VYPLLTVFACQGIPEPAAASLGCDNPGAIDPGRRVADRLLVTTCQVRHPLLRLILMKTDDHALHCHLACVPGRMWTYDLLRTVNDAGREVPGCLRCHQRCHQGRRRWTRAMNCSTGESHSRVSMSNVVLAPGSAVRAMCPPRPERRGRDWSGT
jgi:hypothetical protein